MVNATIGIRRTRQPTKAGEFGARRFNDKDLHPEDLLPYPEILMARRAHIRSVQGEPDAETSKALSPLRESFGKKVARLTDLNARHAQAEKEWEGVCEDLEKKSDTGFRGDTSVLEGERDALAEKKASLELERLDVLQIADAIEALLSKNVELSWKRPEGQDAVARASSKLDAIAASLEEHVDELSLLQARLNILEAAVLGESLREAQELRRKTADLEAQLAAATSKLTEKGRKTMDGICAGVHRTGMEWITYEVEGIKARILRLERTLQDVAVLLETEFPEIGEKELPPKPKGFFLLRTRN